MCNPMLAVAAVSAISGGVGAYGKAKAEKAQANYMAGVEDNNAQSAEWAAADALDRGAKAEARVRQQAAAFKGEQTTRLAANGIDLSSGAGLAILQDTDYLSEQDTLTTRDNARREAWGYNEQARNSRTAAGLYRSQASAIRPGRSAFLSLLGSSGQVASSWYSTRAPSGGGAGSAAS